MSTHLYPYLVIEGTLCSLSKFVAGMKVRDLVKALEEAGWYLARTGKGNHKIYKHPDVAQHITIDGEPGDDVSRGILQDARRISGLPLR